MIRLSFLGAAGTVTGSKYLLEAGGRRLLVDCGLFQGLKELRLRNWEAPAVDPRSVDAVVLTHAHLDHTGYLPRFVRSGFGGPVYCTSATADLTRIILPDAAYLQEEDARYANKRGFSRHKPALPLYGIKDAEDALALLQPAAYDEPIEIAGFRVRFAPAGHILGAAWVRVEADGSEIVFSGDLGRQADALMRPPRPVTSAAHLVIESTYGNRRHRDADPSAELAAIVCRVAAREGVVMIPAFAVGRSQLLLLLLSRLKKAGAIPDIPVFLNSPMAIAATDIFSRHPGEHRLDPEECQAMCSAARYVRTAEESKDLNRRQGPMILIAGSGMATGGRIIHHLKQFAPDPRNAIVLAGFQAAGTRGEAIANGAEAIKIHGEYVPVRAERIRLDELSGHADYVEATTWAQGIAPAPRRVFVTHGEPSAADAFRRHLRDTQGWEVTVPAHGASVELA